MHPNHSWLTCLLIGCEHWIPHDLQADGTYEVIWRLSIRLVFLPVIHSTQCRARLKPHTSSRYVPYVVWQSINSNVEEVMFVWNMYDCLPGMTSQNSPFSAP